MDKKTIFLLPLDLKGKKQTRITPKFIREVYNADKKDILPEHIQKKKNNIFTVELNRLIGKISEKNKNQATNEDKSDEKKIQIVSTPILNTEEKSTPQEQTLSPTPKYEILNRIYSNNAASENADLYLQNLFTSLGIKAYCVFFYEPHTFTYYPLLYKGLSEKASMNLLFQSHDKFLQNKSAGYIHLFFQPVLINDIFFKKKLSNDEFTNYESILLKFFDVHNLPGLLSIFYEKGNHPSSDDIEKLSQTIDREIEPLVPFLNSYFQSQIHTRIDSYDFLKKTINAIRIQSKNLESSFYFTKLKITNFLTLENAVEQKKSITIMLKNYLLKEESLIDMNFNELLLLTKENEVEKIINYLGENLKTDFEFQIKALKYPDNGKNFYLYF